MRLFLICLWIATAGAVMAQNAPPPGTTVPGLDQGAATLVTDAEAAIVKSDWKTAETKLDTWLAGHPTDARALFDAGYVADAQSRLDDAVTLYQRAVAADPKSGCFW